MDFKVSEQDYKMGGAGVVLMLIPVVTMFLELFGKGAFDFSSVWFVAGIVVFLGGWFAFVNMMLNAKRIEDYDEAREKSIAQSIDAGLEEREKELEEKKVE